MTKKEKLTNEDICGPFYDEWKREKRELMRTCPRCGSINTVAREIHRSKKITFYSIDDYVAERVEMFCMNCYLLFPILRQGKKAKYSGVVEKEKSERDSKVKITDDFHVKIDLSDYDFSYEVVGHVVSELPERLEELCEHELEVSRDVDVVEVSIPIIDLIYKIASEKENKIKTRISTGPGI